MSDGSKKAWSVALAGTGINLALGVLYTWSVISKNLTDEWGWSEAHSALPYTIACLVFAFMMVPAGRLQDRIGPRVVASIGGVLTGFGMILASQFINLPMLIIGFGILVGSGIGFGYASATPPAVKWFPAAKTGMIAGIVVSGFGLASVYISPLANAMLNSIGLQNTMLYLGIGFLVVVIALSQLLVNPPAKAPAKGAVAPGKNEGEYTATEMLKTPQFYLLWFMYAFNAGAGLMIIGKLASLVFNQTGSQAGFVLVAILAIGNAGGRLLAGTLSDKLGRNKILVVFTALQCVLMFLTPSVGNFSVLIIFSMGIGVCYGANLALFPSFTKDYYGLKNFGVNYGLIFTAWGIGSLMALVAGKIYDVYGNFDYALYLSGVMLLITIGLSFITKKPGGAAT